MAGTGAAVPSPSNRTFPNSSLCVAAESSASKNPSAMVVPSVEVPA